MTKNKWKKLILEQMSALGVQKDAYNSAVETLAGILEQRDKTFAEFRASGGKSVIGLSRFKGQAVPVVDVPVMSDFRWQLNALKSRLQRPDLYEKQEHVPHTVDKLRHWLIRNIDKATEVERKEAEALFKTGAHRKEA